MNNHHRLMHLAFLLSALICGCQHAPVVDTAKLVAASPEGNAPASHAQAWQVTNATQEDLSFITVLKAEFGVSAIFGQSHVAPIYQSGPRCPIGIVVAKNVSASDLAWEFEKRERMREHEFFRHKA